MLKEPRDQGVVDGHILVQAGLHAELQGPEQAADESYAHLNAAVGLRVVCGRVLLRDGVHAVAAYPHSLEGLRHEGLESWLIVGLHDELRVAQPRDVAHDKAGHELVFAGALVGDDVREDDLRLEASQQDAFDDVATFPGLGQGHFAGGVHGELELATLLRPAARDEEVVEPHDGDPGSETLAVL